MLKLSPVHRVLADRHLGQSPSPRDIQVNTDEVKTKLQDLDQRLGKLEETTKKSLHNIETLLRNAVFQRGPIQLVAPPPQREQSAAQGVSVNHVPVSVPQTVLPVNAYRNTDGTDCVMQPFRNPLRVSVDSTALPRPHSASYNQRTVFHVDTNSVIPANPVIQAYGNTVLPTLSKNQPPTHPPTNAYGSFDDIL